MIVGIFSVSVPFKISDVSSDGFFLLCLYYLQASSCQITSIVQGRKLRARHLAENSCIPDYCDFVLYLYSSHQLKGRNATPT